MVPKNESLLFAELHFEGDSLEVLSAFPMGQTGARILAAAASNRQGADLANAQHEFHRLWRLRIERSR